MEQINSADNQSTAFRRRKQQSEGIGAILNQRQFILAPCQKSGRAEQADRTNRSTGAAVDRETQTTSLTAAVHQLSQRVRRDDDEIRATTDSDYGNRLRYVRRTHSHRLQR
jgi:hypothetical protein